VLLSTVVAVEAIGRIVMSSIKGERVSACRTDAGKLDTPKATKFYCCLSCRQRRLPRPDAPWQTPVNFAASEWRRAWIHSCMPGRLQRSCHLSHVRWDQTAPENHILCPGYAVK